MNLLPQNSATFARAGTGLTYRTTATILRDDATGLWIGREPDEEPKNCVLFRRYKGIISPR